MNCSEASVSGESPVGHGLGIDEGAAPRRRHGAGDTEATAVDPVDSPLVLRLRQLLGRLQELAIPGPVRRWMGHARFVEQALGVGQDGGAGAQRRLVQRLAAVVEAVRGQHGEPAGVETALRIEVAEVAHLVGQFHQHAVQLQRQRAVDVDHVRWRAARDHRQRRAARYATPRQGTEVLARVR